MDKCPICDAECTRNTYAESVGVVEENIDCPNKCYSYHYAYGSTEIFIGDFMTGWHYTTPIEDRKDIDGAIKALIDYYRNHECK
jgi:hypothetical protein